MWPLHRLNAARVPYVLKHLCKHFDRDPEAGQPLAGLSLLDIGCGAGLLSESMARLGAHVTAIDPAERNIAIARQHAEQQGLSIDYRCGVIERIAQSSFDAVLNMEVVEHVECLPSFMDRCCAATKPGGLQFLATINRTALSWLIAIVGAEYIMRYLPRGTHQWRKFVKPREATAMLEKGGLDVVDCRGIKVSPVTRSITEGRVTAINYMLTAAKSIKPAKGGQK